MKNYQKGFVVPLLISIIAILIIGGGVYIYSNKKVENNTPVVVNSNLPAQSNQTSTTTSDWKTYTNTTYGYSIKYPADWKINEDTSPRNISWSSPKTTAESVFIQVGVYPGLSDFPPGSTCPDQSGTGIKSNTIGLVKINNQEFCKYIENIFDGIPPFASTGIIYYPLTEKYSIWLSLRVDGGKQTKDYYLSQSDITYESGILDQMVSTFKFTN
jgi:hypothetical protein